MCVQLEDLSDLINLLSSVANVKFGNVYSAPVETGAFLIFDPLADYKVKPILCEQTFLRERSNVDKNGPLPNKYRIQSIW